MRNVFDKIEDAPPPDAQLRDVYVEVFDEALICLIHYIAKDGKWIQAGRVYPATMD